MIRSVINRYFDRSYSAEKKCFFLAAFSAIFLYFFSVVFSIMVRYGIIFTVFVLMCSILMVAIVYFAESTEKYRECSWVMILLTNTVTLPWVYLMHKSAINGINLFFIIGIVLCVVVFDGLEMIISLLISAIALAAVTIYGIEKFEGTYLIGERSSYVFIEILCAVLLCGTICGLCIKLRMYFYSIEREKALEAKNEAERLDMSKNVFFSNMSHEIRTPMNAILGLSQLLLNSDISENSKDYILNIINACNALISTITDLLDFSRIEMGKIVIDEEKYVPADMLEDIINMMSIKVTEKGLQFLVEAAPAMPQYLIGDEKHLRQVIINLLNNAFMNTEKGKIEIAGEYVSKTGEAAGELIIYIRDTSGGRAEVLHERFFNLSAANRERFITSEDNDNINMTICYELIERMGGSITYSNIVGQGIEFVIRVPQKEVEDYTVPEKSEMWLNRAIIFEKDELGENVLKKALEQCGVEADFVSSITEFRIAFSMKKYTHVFIDYGNYEELKNFLRINIQNSKLVVLADVNQSNVSGYAGIILVRPVYFNNVNAVFTGEAHSSLRKMSVRGNFRCPQVRVMAVDDNATNLQVISSVLSKYEIDVFTALGGMECIYRLEEAPVDLILLDYMMPDMDGIDTLKAIRAMDKEWTKTVPIIALTANAVSGVREKLLSEGFDEYMSKPIEIRTLEKMLRRYLSEEKILPTLEENAG